MEFMGTLQEALKQSEMHYRKERRFGRSGEVVERLLLQAD
jgi:hypothetical protein